MLGPAFGTTSPTAPELREPRQVAGGEAVDDDDAEDLAVVAGEVRGRLRARVLGEEQRERAHDHEYAHQPSPDETTRSAESLDQGHEDSGAEGAGDPDGPARGAR